MRRIGVLMTAAADDPEAKARVAAFPQGLQQLGWIDGRNVRIEYRWAAGDADAHSQTRRGIWSRSRPTSSWQTAARSWPRSAGDPHRADRIHDGRRSGRCRLRREPRAARRQHHRLHQFEYSLSGKWLELLKEIAPRVTRVGVLRDPP